MASTTAQPGRPPRAMGVRKAAVSTVNGTLRPEKVRVGPRHPTPDSEALASSDDDVEKHHSASSRTGPSSTARPPRRPSWLADGHLPQGRKGSLAGAGSVSPLTSQPNSPSVDSPAWGANAAQGSTAVGRPPAVAAAPSSSSSSFPWSSSIWNSEARKDPPARLTEVLSSSATDRSSSAWVAAYDESDSVSSDANFPFAIPLHPTPKSYRSQSYSVGQLEPDANGALPARSPLAPSLLSRVVAAAGSSSGLRGRPSRPSMLSELSRDSTSLDQVQEADDDDDHRHGDGHHDRDDEDHVAAAAAAADEDDAPNGSRWGASHATEAGAFEQMSREKALLRRAAMTHQLESMRLRGLVPNAGGPSSLATMQQLQHQLLPPSLGHRIQESVPEESDYAVDEADEVDELHAFRGRGLGGRRFSEFGADTDARLMSLAFPEHRKIESLKKGYWQSSLGFGGHGDGGGAQSRRHSFADIPARTGSVSSNSEHHFAATDVRPGRMEKPSRLAEAVGRPVSGRVDQGSPLSGSTAALFGVRSGGGGGVVAIHPSATTNAVPIPSPSSSSSAPALHASYGAPGPYGSDRTQSPLGGLSRGAYGPPPSHLGPASARQSQPLCVVTFKCCRADVFYLQEGTGLHVNVGDLVTVEADRGTDLGTVSDANVSWDRARELKERYAEDHYRCLMMFSRHAAQTGHIPGRPTNGAWPAGHASTVGGGGGMGPHVAHPGSHEAGADLRPKMIRRLANPHDVQSLREKEGSEAKAKRICQQKVAEHRLQMEILDAEFQMDWKKLTFYYFADAYINFNSLVTELFKVYKTRIWMSAINPASFASVSPALHAPGGLGYGRQSPYRQQHRDQYYGNNNTNGHGNGNGNHGNHGVAPLDGFQVPFVPSAEPSPVEVAGMTGFPTQFSYGFQAFAPAPRPTGAAMDAVAYGISRMPDRPIEFRPVEFGDLRNDHVRRPAEHDSREPPMVPHEPWMTSFQGLSLGSH